MLGLFLWKIKKGITITITFQKILKACNRKKNKISVDNGKGFFNSSLKKWLKDNDIEMYSIHNEGKSVVAERLLEHYRLKSINTSI